MVLFVVTAHDACLTPAFAKHAGMQVADKSPCLWLLDGAECTAEGCLLAPKQPGSFYPDLDISLLRLAGPDGPHLTLVG